MESFVSIFVSVLAVAVSVISLAYRFGQDTKGEGSDSAPDESMMEQIYKTTETINRKLDEVAQWQREAAGIHATHGEQIKTLFHKCNVLEGRLEDNLIVAQTLRKILEELGER